MQSFPMSRRSDRAYSNDYDSRSNRGSSRGGRGSNRGRNSMGSSSGNPRYSNRRGHVGEDGVEEEFHRGSSYSNSNKFQGGRGGSSRPAGGNYSQMNKGKEDFQGRKGDFQGKGDFHSSKADYHGGKGDFHGKGDYRRGGPNEHRDHASSIDRGKRGFLRRKLEEFSLIDDNFQLQIVNRPMKIQTDAVDATETNVSVKKAKKTRNLNLTLNFNLTLELH